MSSHSNSTNQKDNQMSENKELSLQDLENQLRSEAALADMGEPEFQDNATPIGENSEAHADSVEGENEGTDSKTNPSEDGYDGKSPNTDKTEETAEQSILSEGEISHADSPDKQAAQKTKAQKDEERRDRSWKKLQQERAEFLRQRAEFEASKLTQFQTQLNNPAVNPEALAQSYDELAQQFEDAGDFANADESRRRAESLRRSNSAQQNSQLMPHQTQHPDTAGSRQFMAAWSANVERAKNDFPEMQDENSDFGKTVTALLRAPDTAAYFSGRPDGAYVAAQLTNLKMSAMRVPALEKENAALKEEIKKLRQDMTLPDSGAGGRAGATISFDSMTLAQQEAFLRKQAESDDASAKPAVY